ncbi:MAG TPA: hypothetical protein VKC61_05920 [Pyrinomonadaceae bacterium]|nr:hypothetical protein [Pyrinomonadaceae bacterium]
MNKLNLILFYHLGKEMRTVRRHYEKPMQAMGTLAGKHQWLSKFLLETREVPFPKTRKATRELLKEIRELYSQAADCLAKGDYETVVMTGEASLRMKTLLEDFEREFDHDSREINILSVPNRCAYSTTILIENGESLLPPDSKTAVTDYVRNEFHEAGKCLAFNVSTAAGFHLARGLESALRSYYDVLSSRAPRPKTPSGNDFAMQGYIDQVRKWADSKVVSALEQFTKLHRNPINHPEAVLTDDEAITLVGISVSCITGMVNDVKAKGHASLS